MDIDGPADFVFEKIFAASQILVDGGEPAQANDIAIRLLDKIQSELLPVDNRLSVDYLLNQIGLYPYVSDQNLNFSGRVLREAHRVGELPTMVFHVEQMRILDLLSAGKSIALSAPTSFGKSIIIDAFIMRSYPRRVVIIQPSLALVDETRKRLLKTLRGRYRVVTLLEEDPGDQTIYVLTPERFLTRQDIDKFDFLFIDEFYKYGSRNDLERSASFALCLYRATSRAKQTFLAAPYVDKVEFGERWNARLRFEKTNFTTVAANHFDRKDSGAAKVKLLEDLKSERHCQNLIFSSTPGRCTDLALEMGEADIGAPSELATDVANWLSIHYSENWAIAKALRKGVGIHHGRVPRAVSQAIVKLFNEGHINFLFCTSTLIEGVNTSAKNVFIFDKTINGKEPLDYFTFQNIRGRAGRMFRHFVGNVYTYFEIPVADELIVTADSLKSPSEADPYVLFNLSHEDVNKASSDRREFILGETGLSSSIISNFGSLGVSRLENIRENINQLLNTNPSILKWHDSPQTNEQYETIGNLIWRNIGGFSGVRGHFELTRALKKLHSSRTLSQFVRWFSSVLRHGELNGVDDAFTFLRRCEYSIPLVLRAAEEILLDLEPDFDVDYTSFANAIENWFRASAVRHGEELGIPFVISERIIGRRRDIPIAELITLFTTEVRTDGWIADIERFMCEDLIPLDDSILN